MFPTNQSLEKDEDNNLFLFFKFARNVDFLKVSTAIPSNWTWSANGIFSELLTVNMFKQVTSVVLKC